MDDDVGFFKETKGDLLMKCERSVFLFKRYRVVNFILCCLVGSLAFLYFSPLGEEDGDRVITSEGVEGLKTPVNDPADEWGRIGYVDQEDVTISKELDEWLLRREALEIYAAEFTEFTIPEMDLLTPEDWLLVVKDGELKTEVDFRKALARLRFTAKQKVMGDMRKAIQGYSLEGNIETMQDSLELAPFLPPGFDVKILDRYKISLSGKRDGGPKTSELIILYEEPVDDVFNSVFWISDKGYALGAGRYDQPEKRIRKAVEGFINKNGAQPTSVNQLTDFLSESGYDQEIQEMLFDHMIAYSD
ncbi:hypothetical protein [Pelagicoccus sp. SDUM812005]|uniref:hypothetical protein n=1 Tax=Pelagicoccus sp. SDUM812005 TaxID=3041257 RepID=UPI0028104F53|nr:hypothetical protein [Pelagicoccus sp. SDUM812005]MDQ8182579.1 hypothetical protein [Pelagicoccus sp. SDUM812005]